MDLKLFFAVLWRSKLLVIGGLLAALLLAALTYGKPGMAHGTPTFTPRGTETWQAQAQLLISESSFPYGWAAEQYQNTASTASPIGDTTFMAGLAPIYAAIGNGYVVQAAIHRLGVPGSVSASDVTEAATGSRLPLVNLTASGPTAADVTTLAERAAAKLRGYVTSQQAAARIPIKQRVLLTIVQPGVHAQLVEGHKLTPPILVFMAVLAAVVSLALLRENLRPRTAAALGRVPAPSPRALTATALDTMPRTDGGGYEPVRPQVSPWSSTRTNRS